MSYGRVAKFKSPYFHRINGIVVNSLACTMKGEVGCIKLERPGDARSLTYHLSKLLAYLIKKKVFSNWDLYLRGA